MVLSAVSNVLGAFLNVESTHRFVVMVESVYMGVFTECKLPSLEVKLGTPIREGGANGVYNLPTHIEMGRMTLSKGIGLNSELYDWYTEVAARKWVKAKRSVLVAMIGGPIIRQPVAIWILTGAMPVKWTGPTLKTSENAVAIEQLELIFDSFEALTEGVSPF
jgi:phage tail-like protein